MSEEKVDLRIIKTRKAIKDAFLILVREKGYERITIQDIAKKAMINRNTFYLHYVDKPALLESLWQESIAKLNLCIHLDASEVSELNKEMFVLLLTQTFQVIEEDKLFYQTMLSQSIQTNFIEYLKTSLKMFMLTGFGEKNISLRIKVSMEYMISGLVGVICMWINESEKLVVEEIIEQVSEIHYHNVLDLISNK